MSARQKKAVLSLFLSYAHSDAATLAQRLARDLRARGFDIWLDVEREKPGASWTREIEAGIDNAHVVLALLSRGSFNSDICRAEQLRALRKKKRVLPILMQEQVDVPVHLESEQYLRLYGGDYRERLDQLQAAIYNDKVTVLLPKKYKNHYKTYPPLPRHFVSRPELLDRLRHEIIREGDGSGISLVAIRAMGGLGKTVLAQAICHDEAVQDAFPDGILWANLGNNPSKEHLCEQIRELAKALGDTLEAYDTLQGSQNQLRNTLRDKSVLIVLDDVWDPNHVQFFNADAPRSCLLLTTRNQAVVSGTNAREFIATAMIEQESRELLARKSDLNPESLPPEATRIIQRCAGLPLALSMIGARAGKSRGEWVRILNALDRGKAERVSVKLSDYRYADLFETTQVSVESLGEAQRLRYLDLAIFPSNTLIPQKVLETLWGLPEDEVSDVVESWVEASLASREEGLVKLHDLQLDYVHTQTEHSADLHRRLLNAYKKTITGEWSNGPEDGYYFSHLTHHMLGAGENGELRQLLLNPDWMRTKLEKKGISALLADYDTMVPDPILLQIQQALQLSAHVLAKEPGQLASQMLGRLRCFNEMEIQEILAKMREKREAWLEPLSQSLWQPGAVLVGTLVGHAGAVKAVAIQSDGRRMLSASDDHTLKLWNLESGAEILTLRAHTAPVNAVVLTQDGTLAVSSSYDRTIKVWNLENGSHVRTLPGDAHLVNALALTANGRYLVSASYARQLKVWELNTGTELHTLAGHSGWVNAVAITRDDKLAISASHDQTLKIWDLASGALLRTLAGHSNSVHDVIVAPDGQRILSVSDDNTIRVWDIASGTQLLSLVGHTGGVNAVSVAPSSKEAVSASQDNTIRVWDLETGLERRVLTGHMGPVNGVLLLPEGRRAISVSDDGTLRIWDLEIGVELQTLAAHSGPVNAVLATSDGSRVVSVNGSEGSALKVWDFASGSNVGNVANHSQMVNAVAISPDGQLVVSASADKTLKIRELESDKVVHTLVGHTDSVNSVAITGDMRAVSASSDNTLKVWDLITGATIHTLAGHSRAVDHVVVTSDGTQAVSAGCDRTLKLWGLDTGKELCTLAGHSGWVRHVLVTPDGRRAVSASYDHTVKVWDLQRGILLHTLAGHDSWTNEVALNTATGCVVSASYDDTLMVWDLESGKHIHTLTGHTGSVSSVAIMPDRKLAVSASHDHTLRVWNLENGTHVRTLRGHERSVNAVAVTANHVVSASNDSTVKIWTVEGKVVATFSAEGPIICLAVHTDQQTIVAGDYQGRTHTLRLREPGAGSQPGQS